jgi:orotate phosphoribosyltransferase
MVEDLIALLAARKGHFRLESGHHGDLWLDLDALLRRPGRLRPFVAALAQRLAAYGVEGVCGPQTGGAFVAAMVAAELDVEFFYAERVAPPPGAALYATEYRVPAALRGAARGKAIAIVDDVINAGSAVRGTLADLVACGARPAAIGALLVLGDAASSLAGEQEAPLVSSAQLASSLWTPSDCPLCAAGALLEEGGVTSRR